MNEDGTKEDHGSTSATGHSSGSAEHSEAASAAHGEPTSAAHGETTTTASNSETTASAAHSEPTASTSHGESTAAEVLAELPASSAHQNAKRAILMISNEYADQQELNYNPMEMSKSMQEKNINRNETANNQEFHWTMWCKYIAMTMITTTMQVISSGGYNDDSVTSSHHLMRRSEPGAEGGEDTSFTDTMTPYENAFVYKIFLIFAGLILVINSMIKALNTKISGTFFF